MGSWLSPHMAPSDFLLFMVVSIPSLVPAVVSLSMIVKPVAVETNKKVAIRDALELEQRRSQSKDCFAVGNTLDRPCSLDPPKIPSRLPAPSPTVHSIGTWYSAVPGSPSTVHGKVRIFSGTKYKYQTWLPGTAMYEEFESWKTAMVLLSIKISRILRKVAS